MEQVFINGVEYVPKAQPLMFRDLEPNTIFRWVEDTSQTYIKISKQTDGTNCILIGYGDSQHQWDIVGSKHKNVRDSSEVVVLYKF